MLKFCKKSYFSIEERHVFEFNSYLYQGREMLLLDIAGESDPFVVVSISNQSIQSKTIDNSVNPTWNQTLSLPEVFLYGSVDDIIRNPPEVFVKIYDSDPFNVRLNKLLRDKIRNICFLLSFFRPKNSKIKPDNLLFFLNLNFWLYL